MTTRKIMLRDAQEALAVLGEQDCLLRQMESDYGVELCLSQDRHADSLHLLIRGKTTRVQKILKTLKAKLSSLRDEELPLTRQDLSGAPSAPQTSLQARMSKAAERSTHPSTSKSPQTFGAVQTSALPHEGLYRNPSGRIIQPRTANQKKYIEAIERHELAFGIGPAGTGKTFLAVACALRALETRQVQRIVLSRPVVEAGERLGFLPGDLLEKVNPYLTPLYDSFYSMIGPERFRLWRESEVIEIVPLAYMRGRTFNDAFIILDEAQNTTLGQIKLALTRLGEGSRMVVTGDITQTDLEGSASGLVRIMEILKEVPGIAFHHLTGADIVRHAMVRRVIEAFEKWEKKK